MNSYFSKSKLKSSLASLAIFAASLTITACSSGTQSLIPKEPSSGPLPVVSQSEFDEAAKSFEVEVDEFNGTVFLSAIRPENLLDSGVRQGKNFVSANLDSSKAEENENFDLTIVVSYLGEDWLFFDTLDLKSSTGSMQVIFERSNKTEEVFDGGNVNEIAVASLTDTQIQELSELLKGSDLKFRINGSGDNAGEDFTGDFSKWMIKNFKDGITLNLGLKQGLKLQ